VNAAKAASFSLAAPDEIKKLASPAP